MALLFTLIGITLILAVLRDVFRTLFPYAEKITASRVVIKDLWRGLHRLGVRRLHVLYAAGPLAFLAVVGGWFVLSAVGWAFVYWPHMSSAFSFREGLEAAARGGFLDALYFSLGTQATVGYGDIVPTNPWLMMSAMLQVLCASESCWLHFRGTSPSARHFPSVARWPIKLPSSRRRNPTPRWL